ncbi:cysteine hydrolase [Pseudoduganella umbonata]|uniref:Cysteine hydrolase n=1 Tax=Pseudoduganella umbonata TaxID=864828 RepID=A0A4P8HXS5_9BURK|nr:cysteine hydrolase [Pseudoduganella umbonata]MBB3223319.1 nicotinamidase-related amidase [Pseudoduganella umbonata]QCP13772.1 cysteine hydrolase [Pseudoduganella umbonata]
MKDRLHLLVIDPQNDFCDLPPESLPIDAATGRARMPALPVPGAHADMLRLAQLIERGRAGIAAITVTLDSHHRYHVAHPTFWLAGDGGPVMPFTEITAADVRAARFLPRERASKERALAYLDALEAAGRYRLMVWPVHCEIGTWGHNVHDAVRTAYNRWEDAALGVVAKIAKGSNPWTEHYSAVMAEVPDAADPGTQENRELLASLRASDRVYIAGEAGSHCVKSTVEHIAERLGSDASKLVLITDCMSPVQGFAAEQEEFFARMRAAGVGFAQASDVAQELLVNAGR